MVKNIFRKIAAAFCLLILLLPTQTRAGDDTQARMAALEAETNAAIDQIVAIVNQPITHLVRMPHTTAIIYSPGWFHPGAIKPDFSQVDIRKTQKFPYQRNRNVTSDLNRSEMFIANELEFNPMTKYFYLDLTLPKKRLSEAEMVEINRLYRIIGRNEKKLAHLKKPGLGELFGK